MEEHRGLVCELVSHQRDTSVAEVREGLERKAARGEATGPSSLPSRTLNHGCAGPSGLPRPPLFAKGPRVSLISLSGLPDWWSEGYKYWKIWTPPPVSGQLGPQPATPAQQARHLAVHTAQAGALS